MPEIFSKREMQRIVTSYPEPLPVGKEVRINHAECPMGVDRKRRLYLKNNGDGVMMYCFHCGQKGFLRAPDKIKRADELACIPHADTLTETLLRGEKDVKVLWAEGEPNVCIWPTEARLWWYSYEMTDTDALTYRVKWSDEAGRLLLYANDTCYQGRGFNVLPKYLTWKWGNDVVHFLTPEAKRVIVVEDLVSSYKLHKAGCSVVCLMGTKLDDLTTDFICANFTEALVWLDNDVAGKVGAQAAYTRLHQMIECSTMSIHQPKELPLTFLHGVA